MYPTNVTLPTKNASIRQRKLAHGRVQMSIGGEPFVDEQVSGGVVPLFDLDDRLVQYIWLGDGQIKDLGTRLIAYKIEQKVGRKGGWRS